MKISKKSFVSRARLFFNGALFALLFASFAVQSGAQTITKGTSSVGFDPNLGLTNWVAGGVNQLILESFYYNLNGGGASLLNNSSFQSVSTGTHGSSPFLSAAYNLGVIVITNSYTLSGGLNNQYTLTYAITVKNVSGSSQGINFYQYSDFNLGGATGSQNVTLTTTGPQDFANQTGGGVSLTDSEQGIGAGLTMGVQANNSGAPFGPLNGSSSALDNTTLTAAGNAVYAFEWDDLSLAAGSSFTISETQTITVPEPSSVVLISSGMLALAFLRRRRRGA